MYVNIVRWKHRGPGVPTVLPSLRHLGHLENHELVGQAKDTVGHQP